jgi:Skp family chaperone for outer membrane proteins
MIRRAVFILVIFTATLALFAADSRQPNPAPASKHAVAMVDVARVSRECKLAQKLSEEFRAWRASYDAEMNPKLELLKQKQEAYQKDQEKLPADEKDKRAKELQALQQEIFQKQREAQQEFKQREQEAGAKLQAQVMPILAAMGAQNGWDVILNKGDQTLWLANGVDVTDEVIRRVDESMPPEAPAAAAQQK